MLAAVESSAREFMSEAMVSHALGWTVKPTDEHKREHGHGRYGQAVLDVGDSGADEKAGTLGQEHVEHHSPPAGVGGSVGGRG